MRAVRVLALGCLFLPQRHIQRVHTNEESKFNYARNFVGLINLAVFNNGYHTIHHEAPGIHWSETPATQKKIQNLIDPSLNERSFWWYILRVYLARALSSPFRRRLKASGKNQCATGENGLR